MQDTSSHIKVFVICYVIYGSNKKLFINKFESTLHFIAKLDMITGNNQRLVIEGVWAINQRSKCFFPNLVLSIKVTTTTRTTYFMYLLTNN